MIHQLRSDIKEALKSIEQIKSLDSKIVLLNKDISSLEKKERELWSIVQKEEQDVTRLQRMSATAILHSIIGDKDTKLDQEQAEAIRAKLNYDAILHQLEGCKRQLSQYFVQKEQLLPYQQSYPTLFNKLREVLKHQPIYAEQLLSLEQRNGVVTNQIKEIQEALTVCDLVIEQLQEIRSELSSAKSWGTWDMFGGGIVTSMIKHSHLDTAQSKVEKLETLLQQLKNELADVQRVDNVGIVNVDGFMRFADYFFDNFFVDWMVLSKINNSSQQVQEVAQQVDVLHKELSDLYTAYQQEKEQLDAKITEYVIHS